MSANNVERFRRPEVVFADLLKTFSQGGLVSQGEQSVLHRAVVLAVDPEGGLLQGPNKKSVAGVALDSRKKSYDTIPGPANPRNSVKAVVMSNGLDSFYSEEDARVFWPLFPPDQLALPVAPGEHIYVLFEDSFREHGLWIGRIPGFDSANFSPGAESLEKTRTQAPKKLNSAFDGDSADPPSYRTDDGASVNGGSKKNLSSLFED